jgi:dTDP-4-dehydrorhamnose 3,5-epimerase-like enzyme
MAKKCLKNILKSKKILINDKPVHFKQCVIIDLMNTSNVVLHGFHTDVEYSYFTGNAFNVWYLIENNKNYGNMFILESDEYKKNILLVPCIIKVNRRIQ